MTKSTIVESSLSKIEKEVIQATTSGEIISLVHKKNPDEAQAKFKTILKRCATLCSLKTVPDEFTISFLYKYLTQTCGTSTFEEVEKAFYFNQAGHFGERIKHFDAFDVNFLSQVMEQWLIMKTKTRQRIAALLPPPTQKVETDEDSYNGLVAYIRKNADFPEFWAWTKVYNWMDECLMIEETNETKKELYDKVYHRLKNKLELEILDMKNANDRKERLESLPDDVKTECRKIMIKKYLKF